MEYNLTDEQVKEYGTAFKLFSESYMTGMPLEKVEENLETIERIMKEMPGDGDGEIYSQYIVLGIISNKLRKEYAERTLEEKKKILKESSLNETMQKAITIDIPEAEKQKRLSEEWLHYFGADVEG